MDIIIFEDVPLKTRLDAVSYKGTGNANCTYTGKVIFPINAILATTLKKQDKATVILLATRAEGKSNEQNILLFKNELDEINKNIGASIDYKVVESDFCESKSNYEKRFRNMIATLHDEVAIYADITYGPKPLVVVLLCVLGFAQKFGGADIKRLVYAKVLFDKENHIIEGSQELFDVTSLYYLSGLVNSLEAENSDDAKKALDAFFGA